MTSATMSHADQYEPEMVAELASAHTDIIQTDLDADSVKETLKLIHAFRWPLAFSPQSKWLMLVRDDVTVIPINLVRSILSVTEAMRQRLIAGAVWDDPLQSDVDKLLFPGRLKKMNDKKDRYLTFVATSLIVVCTVLSPVIYLTTRFTAIIDQPELLFAAVMHKLSLVRGHMENLYAFNRKLLTNEKRSTAIAYWNV